MDFTSALEDLIDQALEDEDTCISDITFALAQSTLNLRLAVLQAAEDDDSDELAA